MVSMEPVWSFNNSQSARICSQITAKIPKVQYSIQHLCILYTFIFILLH